MLLFLLFLFVSVYSNDIFAQGKNVYFTTNNHLCNGILALRAIRVRVLCVLVASRETHSTICVSIDLTELLSEYIDAINKIGIYDKYADDAPKFSKKERKRKKKANIRHNEKRKT